MSITKSLFFIICRFSLISLAINILCQSQKLNNISQFPIVNVVPINTLDVLWVRFF
jgi:hypothetical protein